MTAPGSASEAGDFIYYYLFGILDAEDMLYIIYFAYL